MQSWKSVLATKAPFLLILNPRTDDGVVGILNVSLDGPFPVDFRNLANGFGPPEEMFALNPRSGKWPAVRKAHLEKHPTCAACGGTAFLQAHHLMPFHLDPSLELKESNLITLCQEVGKSCHFFFGHCGSSWSDFNPNVVEDAAYFLKRVKNRAKGGGETA